MPLPTPYDGNKPFIFVSYAHRDKHRALPVIERLCAEGYRVWYDQGIDPGTEWDETIAAHVETCGCFIALMSRAYLDSSNCKDELNYARDCEKERLIVYLEDVTLPSGMAMRINRLQAIFKYTYSDEAAFYDKLFSTPSLDICRGDCSPITTPPSDELTPGQKKAASFARTWAPFFACVTATAATVIGLLLNPDSWSSILFAVIAISGGCTSMSTTKNRVIGGVGTLCVLAASVCVCMRLFFPLETWGVLIGAPLCAPFVGYTMHWWSKR